MEVFDAMWIRPVSLVYDGGGGEQVAETRGVYLQTQRYAFREE